MSYDLVAFDPAAAPRERTAFLGWIKTALSETPSAGDPAAAAPELWAWRNDMSQTFPAADAPGAFDPYSPSETRNASYRFANKLVIASLHWDVSGQAIYQARRSAQAHRIGLFDASGTDRCVWMVSGRGRFEIVHSDANEYGAL
ncbi:MAG: hypothetical protein GC155_17470 [Alphaproteobacteria bacterium]|nr:hypothetical protein [Alphaproteobacteria bacterium]